LVVRDSPRFPNDVKQFPIFNRVIRYVTTGTVTGYTWTARDLLWSMVWATNAGAQTMLLQRSVRLRRVSMYFVPSTGDFGASTAVLNFSWIGTSNAPDNLIIDRGTATMPACIKTRPIPDSQSGFWYNVNSTGLTNGLFVISCPANTVIDIEYEFVLTTAATTNAAVLSVNATQTSILFLGYNGANIVPDGGVQTGHV
jgi:hypothetical protein